MIGESAKYLRVVCIPVLSIVRIGYEESRMGMRSYHGSNTGLVSLVPVPLFRVEDHVRALVALGPVGDKSINTPNARGRDVIKQ